MQGQIATGLRLSGRSFLQCKQPKHENTSLQMQGAGPKVCSGAGGASGWAVVLPDGIHSLHLSHEMK